MSGQSSGYIPESEECLTALADAHALIDTAARRLAAAPDADPLAKNAIEAEVSEIRTLLNTITARLDEMPTA